MQSVSDDQIARLSADVPPAVGDRIMMLRKARKLSQTELAESAGKDRQYLYKIEKGRVNPSITTLAIIAKALEVSLSELFEDIRI